MGMAEVRMKPVTLGLAPCFYFSSCGARAVVAKCGKSVCRSCAEKFSGEERAIFVAGKRVPGREYPNFWFGEIFR